MSTYIAYNDLTLGTVAGVLGKLSSPSLALQLEAVSADTLAIASVDTTLNTITTGVAALFQTGNPVQFAVSTGGALPAPLVAATTYYAIYVTDVTFQVSAVKGGAAIDLATAGSGTMTVQNVTLTTVIQSVLDDTKNKTLRYHLDNWLRDVMPETIDKWVQLRSNTFHRYRPRANNDTLPLYGMFRGSSDGGIWYSDGGAFVGLNGNSAIPNRPLTYFITTPPINGNTAAATLWGQCVNGARLVDVVARKLYVNRGSDTANPPTVVWDRQNSEDCKNYIINPEILAQPHEYLAISRLFELGTFRDRLGFDGADMKTFMMDGQAYFHNKFISGLYGERDERGRTISPGILRLIQTDFANSGEYSDFDREMAGDEHFGFV